MSSKLRVKAGNIEVEFEGSDEYLKEELPSLLQLLFSLGPVKAMDDEGKPAELNSSADTPKKKLQMTTNTISAKLSVKSGGDLILAACAHLAFVKEKNNFSRSDILTEMKQASNYFKETYSKNLSASIKTLVTSNKILETSSGIYALQAQAQKEIEAKLNDS